MPSRKAPARSPRKSADPLRSARPSRSAAAKASKEQEEDLRFLNALLRFADEKKAESPVALDLREIEGPVSFFMICSGQSSPQLRAIADSIQKGVAEEFGRQPLARDGSRESGWLVLDFGHILVHIFSQEKRLHYALEDLWRDAKRVVLKIPGIPATETP